MNTFDSRCKRLADNPRFILINNFKCGFSSSNLLAWRPVTKIRGDDEVILFYRDVCLRAVSVFINWCINDDRYVRQDGWLLENLNSALGAASYRRLLDFLHAGKHTEAFRIYVEVLEAIAAQNSHTLPQVALLEYYGICRIDHFVELENSAEFQRITNIPFPHEDTNKSDAVIKQSVMGFLSDNDFLQYQLQKIYEKDLDFFSRNGLECIGWQAPG